MIVDRPRRRSAAAEGAGRPWLWLAAAAAAFAALCITVLSTAPQLVEPDDHAYQASIIAATQGHWLTLSTAQVHALGAQFAQVGPHQRIAGQPRRRPASPHPVGRAAQRTLDQREGSRLPVPGRAVPVARPHPPSPPVLRCAGLPGPVRRRPALAGRHRRCRSRRLVLLVGGGVGLRVARLHADLHRCLADRRGHRGPAVGPAGRRGRRAPANRDRASRIPGPRGRGVPPLHRPRRAGLRRSGRPRRPVAATRERAARGSGVVARLGRGVWRGRGRLR